MESAGAGPVAWAPLRVSVATDRKVFAVTVAVLSVLYLLLVNRYWVPGGDSEVYVGIARNLAVGNGLMFNGQPVGMVPPGWSIVMAAVMLISPTFLALKLTALVSMVVALGTFYWICRRYASPGVSALAVLVSGVLSHVYSLTFWLHSDAFFVMVCALAILVAMQINEGRSLKTHLPLLLLLCAASVFVRWAGVLNWLLIAAVLLRGQLAPKLDRYWISAAASGAVTAAIFLVLPPVMKAWAPPPVQYEQGMLSTDGEQLALLEEGEGLIEQADSFIAEGYQIVGTGADMPPLLYRFVSWGTWFSFLFWQPLRLGAGWAAVWWVATISGWILISVLIAATVNGLRARDWLLLAVMVYTLLLSLRWTHANARYVVPLAPLVVLGLIVGTNVLRDALHPRWARTTLRSLLIVCIASIFIVNLLLYGTEVWVMRSDRFYDRYEAGLNRSLIAVAQYLNKAGVGHGQVAINPRYENLGRARNMPTGLRGFTMLTNKAMVSVPRRYLNKGLPRYRPFRFWLSEQNIQYYLEQYPVSPWRVWHFRVPWLQMYKTNQPIEKNQMGWRLFRCDGKSIPLQVEVPEEIEYPTRVPGM